MMHNYCNALVRIKDIPIVWCAIKQCIILFYANALQRFCCTHNEFSHFTGLR